MNKQKDSTVLDIAYDILEKSVKPVNFYKLIEKLANNEKINLDDEEATSFYMSMLLDKRFVMCGSNTWSTRNKFKFNEIHIDLKKVYETDTSTAEFTDTMEFNESGVLEKPKKRKKSLTSTIVMPEINELPIEEKISTNTVDFEMTDDTVDILLDDGIDLPDTDLEVVDEETEIS